MDLTSLLLAEGQESAVVQSQSRLRWERLYREFAPGAKRLAYLLVGEGAEDLVQDAFLRIYVRFQDRRAPDDFLPYLQRTMVNLSTDRLRRLRTADKYRLKESPQYSPDPADAVAYEQFFRGALRALPPRQRAALVLRYCLDFSEEQTADVLRCSPAAAKQLVARATRKLRRNEEFK